MWVGFPAPDLGLSPYVRMGIDVGVNFPVFGGSRWVRISLFSIPNYSHERGCVWVLAPAAISLHEMTLVNRSQDPETTTCTRIATLSHPPS